MFEGALGAAKRALHRRMARGRRNDDAAHLDIGKESLMMSWIDMRVERVVPSWWQMDPLVDHSTRTTVAVPSERQATSGSSAS